MDDISFLLVSDTSSHSAQTIRAFLLSLPWKKPLTQDISTCPTVTVNPFCKQGSCVDHRLFKGVYHPICYKGARARSVQTTVHPFNCIDLKLAEKEVHC